MICSCLLYQVLFRACFVITLVTCDATAQVASLHKSVRRKQTNQRTSRFKELGWDLCRILSARERAMTISVARGGSCLCSSDDKFCHQSSKTTSCSPPIARPSLLHWLPCKWNWSSGWLSILIFPLYESYQKSCAIICFHFVLPNIFFSADLKKTFTKLSKTLQLLFKYEQLTNRIFK